MNRRNFVGVVMLVVTLIAGRPTGVSAQWREAPLIPRGSAPLAASLPVLGPEHHFGDQVAPGLDDCEPSRTARVAGGALGGAAIGWLMFRVTVGILAGGENDDVTRRLRTQFVLGGAVAGAVLGALPRSSDTVCNRFANPEVSDTTP